MRVLLYFHNLRECRISSYSDPCPSTGHKFKCCVLALFREKMKMMNFRYRQRPLLSTLENISTTAPLFSIRVSDQGPKSGTCLWGKPIIQPFVTSGLPLMVYMMSYRSSNTMMRPARLALCGSMSGPIRHFIAAPPYMLPLPGDSWQLTYTIKISLRISVIKIARSKRK